MLAKNLKINKKSLGFSLLESIVAIFILVLVLTGPLTLAYRSIRFAEVARDKLIAANLAQEGIELILAKRADNFLAGDPDITWLDGMDICATSECAVDSSANPPNIFSYDACKSLVINSGVYACSAALDGFYRRKINITKINDDEYKITSTVSWTNRYGTSEFILKEHILNWPVPTV